jgi:hypothetical protein
VTPISQEINATALTCLSNIFSRTWSPFHEDYNRLLYKSFDVILQKNAISFEQAANSSKQSAMKLSKTSRYLNLKQGLLQAANGIFLTNYPYKDQLCKKIFYPVYKIYIVHSSFQLMSPSHELRQTILQFLSRIISHCNKQYLETAFVQALGNERQCRGLASRQGAS